MRFSVTATTAVIACSCMAAAYVGVLYTLPHAIRRLPRDHPTHILARFLLICIFCALCPFVLAVFYDHDEASMSFAQWLGIRWEGLVQAIVVPLFATAVLFTGSLLSNALRLLNVSKQFHSNGMWFAIKNSALYYSITHDRLPSLRTYVLGPLTEEFVFRSCMVPLLVCAEFTVKQIVLGSPLMFGAAHLHHFMEYVRHGRSPKEAALTVGFQLIYTSLFGAYATFIFLRTGHFVSIFLVHMFCNVMGFPDLSFFNPENGLHPYRIVLLGAYLIGIYGFSRLLMPLTEPAIYSSEMWNVTASAKEHELVFRFTETL
ncbi:CAAX prenyl protease [Phytophthora boehmeriae]|uniref:intramembrane prenyl-peptidase Rce1 n=1 Tax=Phytophthora boehmeriae TaxID=109152 RepID=A0A8T1VN85_9STRA|nr:CAAX prenyl protease [Phytophthora boehmeriae]